MVKINNAMATGLVAVALATCLTSCGGSAAEDACRDALEAKYGKDGVVDLEDLDETTSGNLTKVEGALTYRKDQGAGDRVDTSFTCQLEGDEDDYSVRELTVKD